MTESDWRSRAVKRMRFVRFPGRAEFEQLDVNFTKVLLRWVL